MLGKGSTLQGTDSERDKNNLGSHKLIKLLTAKKSDAPGTIRYAPVTKRYALVTSTNMMSR